MSDEQTARDVCPECGSAGEFLGERVSGGPSVGAGAPNYTECWRCPDDNCDTEWTA